MSATRILIDIQSISLASWKVKTALPVQPLERLQRDNQRYGAALSRQGGLFTFDFDRSARRKNVAPMALPFRSSKFRQLIKTTSGMAW
jgi:hypothetical protein